MRQDCLRSSASTRLVQPLLTRTSETGATQAHMLAAREVLAPTPLSCFSSPFVNIHRLFFVSGPILWSSSPFKGLP
jgi:hypothetical protein